MAVCIIPNLVHRICFTDRQLEYPAQIVKSLLHICISIIFIIQHNSTQLVQYLKHYFIGIRTLRIFQFLHEEIQFLLNNIIIYHFISLFMGACILRMMCLKHNTMNKIIRCLYS